MILFDPGFLRIMFFLSGTQPFFSKIAPQSIALLWQKRLIICDSFSLLTIWAYKADIWGVLQPKAIYNSLNIHKKNIQDFGVLGLANLSFHRHLGMEKRESWRFDRGNFQLAREKCQAALMGAEGNAAMAAMSLEVGAMIQAGCDTLCRCIGSSLDTKLA